MRYEEQLERHVVKAPALITPLLKKGHYILIIITLAIGGYTVSIGLKDITPKPEGLDSSIVTIGNYTLAPSFIPESK